MLTFKFDFLRSLVKHLLLIINKLFYKMNWKKRKRNVIKVILIIEKISILVSMMSKKIFFCKILFFFETVEWKVQETIFLTAGRRRFPDRAGKLIT